MLRQCFFIDARVIKRDKDARKGRHNVKDATERKEAQPPRQGMYAAIQLR
jgi:hypothetical protein